MKACAFFSLLGAIGVISAGCTSPREDDFVDDSDSSSGGGLTEGTGGAASGGAVSGGASTEGTGGAASGGASTEGTGGAVPEGSGGQDSDPTGSGGDGGEGLPFPEATLIATNNAVYCALVEGSTVCWGTGAAGQTEFPVLHDIVGLSNDYFIRALGANGTSYTLINDEDPSWWEPYGSDLVFLGDHFLRADGSLDIPDSPDGVIIPGIGPVLDGAAVGFNSCLLQASDRSIVCDGAASVCEVPGSEFVPPQGRFLSLDSGDAHFCALAEDNTVTCWGAGSVGPDEPPLQDGICLLAGSVVKQGQNQAPAGTFIQVSAGTIHSCGVRTDGTVACWGAGTTNTDCEPNVLVSCGQSLPPPDSDFVQVAAGNSNTCGLKNSGKVVCWGADTGGRSTPPPELRP